jgi:hypothetical protein
VHDCPGVHLGRLETRSALEALLRRIPDHELAADEVHWHHIFATQQMASLPICFTPATRAGRPSRVPGACAPSSASGARRT